MPVCRKCGIDKPAEAFSIRTESKSGLRNECKDCVSVYNRETQPWKKYQKKSPLRVWCGSESKKLMRAGLIKKGPCVVCGAKHSRNGKALEFHHTDYRYPEKGYWVCRLCHRNLPPGLFQQECFAFMEDVIKNYARRMKDKLPKKRTEARSPVAAAAR